MSQKRKKNSSSKPAAPAKAKKQPVTGNPMFTVNPLNLGEIREKAEILGISTSAFLTLAAINSCDEEACKIVEAWYKAKAGIVVHQDGTPVVSANAKFTQSLDELEEKGYIWVKPPVYSADGREVESAICTIFDAPEDNPHFKKRIS